jgi:hypothetical protein
MCDATFLLQFFNSHKSTDFSQLSSRLMQDVVLKVVPVWMRTVGSQKVRKGYVSDVDLDVQLTERIQVYLTLTALLTLTLNIILTLN